MALDLRMCVCMSINDGFGSIFDVFFCLFIIDFCLSMKPLEENIDFELI